MDKTTLNLVIAHKLINPVVILICIILFVLFVRWLVKKELKKTNNN